MSQGYQAVALILDLNHGFLFFSLLFISFHMLMCKLFDEIKYESTFLCMCDADQAAWKLAVYLHVREWKALAGRKVCPFCSSLDSDSGRSEWSW